MNKILIFFLLFFCALVTQAQMFVTGVQPKRGFAYTIQAAAGSSATTPFNVPYPSPLAKNDLIIMHVVVKYAGTATITTPGSGWVLAATAHTGGAGAAGADAGNIINALYYKVSTGAETGNLSLATPSLNGARAVMYVIKGDPRLPWDVARINGGSDNTAGTAWSVTTGGVILYPNDLLFIGSGANSDAHGVGNGTLSQTGATFSTATKIFDSGTTAGDDLRPYVHWATVTTSGAASNAVTFTMTAGTSGANAPAGATTILAIRQ